jgi:hypothetical protein
MSSRRGSETDQNPEASIETRVALAAICELVRVRGNTCPRALRWRRNAKDGGAASPAGSVGPMATLTSLSVKRSILARWRARDSCADRLPISGHRNTFSGYFRCPRIDPPLPQLCGAHKDEVAR